MIWPVLHELFWKGVVPRIILLIRPCATETGMPLKFSLSVLMMCLDMQKEVKNGSHQLHNLDRKSHTAEILIG